MTDAAKWLTGMPGASIRGLFGNPKTIGLRRERNSHDLQTPDQIASGFCLFDDAFARRAERRKFARAAIAESYPLPEGY
jgi:hypothetical protein